MDNITHELGKETRAASLLKEHLLMQLGGEEDTDLIRDTIEGELNLNALFDEAALEIIQTQGQIHAIDDMVAKLKARQDRYERRIGHIKTAVQTAMETAEVKSHRSPYGTFSRRAVPPSVIISNEADIPSQYWKPSDPRLDKKAVLEALKAKQDVPGASLSNGSETIAFKV